MLLFKAPWRAILIKFIVKLSFNGILEREDSRSQIPNSCLNTIDRLQMLCPWLNLSPSWWCLCQNNHESVQLRLLISYPPFKASKRQLWLCIICAVLWKVWDEWNARIFQEKFRSTKDIIDTIIHTTFLWCKDIPAIIAIVFPFL